MEERRQKSIRTLYYSVILLVLILQSISFSIVYLFNLKKDYSRFSQQIFNNTMDQKEIQIKLIVDEKISDIYEYRVLLEDQYNETAKLLNATLSHLIERDLLDEWNLAEIKWFPSETWNFQILDRQTGKKINTSLTSQENKEVQTEMAIEYNSIVSDRYELFVYMSQKHFNKAFIKGVHSLIHSAKLPDDGYIWINQILDFKGGDNYALRLIHPNIPESEGTYLSTSTQDIKGNYPYLEELEGINTKGEAIHEYYFKKLDSDLIIRKLSYAKLISEYNWVIATGINLDDVDLLFEQEKIHIEQMYKVKVRWFLFIISIALFVSLGINILFEKRVSLIINKYIAENIDEKQKLAEAYEQMKNMAYYDSLTGLLNRPAIFELLQKEASLFSRERRGFCLILSDIDRFKNINDSYGHNFGDFVLKELAQLMKDNIRLEDQVSRWGGEEFLFLIRNCSLEKGIQIAEKIRKTIESHLFQEQGIIIPVTMTFGVASTGNDMDLKELINEADKKLYRGKRASRNCVVG